ncbi:hypothetical protein AB0B04_18955 [Streptomyces xinghaiensis]|uniref:hypothetical protein n=1 Tax=Streptomyces TaxID=1883 RepID=UPI0004D36831|nr:MULTISPECIES: hypothetical protein [Streptomyces]OFA36641.1 hypothetical protein BEN35_29740 [Streptomyces fradiae]
MTDPTPAAPDTPGVAESFVPGAACLRRGGAPPFCPVCSTVTERIDVEDEEGKVWRCTAPDCARRTYGTGDPEDDDELSPYIGTDEDGATTIYHGTGDIDIEATAELAAQDGPEEEDAQDAG